MPYDRDNHDLSTKWAKDYFYLASAEAWITNSKGERFDAIADDFSPGDPHEWVCKDENGNDNHGDNETCVVYDKDITE